MLFFWDFCVLDKNIFLQNIKEEICLWNALYCDMCSLAEFWVALLFVNALTNNQLQQEAAEQNLPPGEEGGFQ